MFWFLLLFYGISRRLTGASVSSSSILDEAPSTNFFFPIVTLWVCFLICCWRDTLHKPEILRYWVFRCRFLSFSGLTFKVPSDQEDFVNLNFPLLWYSRQFVQGNITVNIFKSVWCNDWRHVTEKKESKRYGQTCHQKSEETQAQFVFYYFQHCNIDYLHLYKPQICKLIHNYLIF